MHVRNMRRLVAALRAHNPKAPFDMTDYDRCAIAVYKAAYGGRKLDEEFGLSRLQLQDILNVYCLPDSRSAAAVADYIERRYYLRWPSLVAKVLVAGRMGAP